MKLEFRLLGDVAVLADGRPLELGGTRQRSVLALLVLQRDRPIATELLADRLWPDEQPLSAIKTIQVYVSRIRRALGPNADRLSSSATGYRLAVADDELDAARFERGLRQAREALTAGSPETALAGLEATLAEWSGPALGDLAGEQFARREADRLEELRLQALEELFELRISAGAGRATIGELRRLAGEQPGRERLWRLLMLALYADGRQGEALEAYHDARRYLADELGLDPGPELAELELAILTQEAPRPEGMPAMVQVAGLGAAIDLPTIAGDVAETQPSDRRRRVVTVLRADVGRASGGDGLDPEILEALDRRAEALVRRAVERHGGTIDRVEPGSVTAIFGLTVSREDDALRAVRAAFELTGDAPADSNVVRVGVATGEILAGTTNAHGSMVSGAPLQAAIALAATAKPRETLLSTETEQLVRGAASTQTVSLPPGVGATAASAVRLLGLNPLEAITRTTTTPLVGRAAELEALGVAFERTVSDGAPGLVTVIGAPGVGKSRLAAEAFARMSRTARVLRSRCLPYGEGITYWPVREFVFAGSGILPGDSRLAALHKIEAVVGGSDRGDIVTRGIASVTGLTDDPVPVEELPWAVRRFMEALATERPLVLLVDDIQWAEPVLLELLEHVLDLGRGPVLVVTVARPELEDTRPEWLARSSLQLIRLDALDEADAATLLDQLAPELPSGPLRSRILAAAEGNPLFVEQFVAYMSDEAVADARSLGARTPPHLPIPPTIGALLAARLDRLPDVERRLLERAAVIGRTFWTGALAELVPKADHPDLPRGLARLARKDLIRPNRTEFLDLEAFRFRHLLIRDAAYASLPKRERADLHARFADWLELRSEAGPGEYGLIVGYHLEQASRYRMELGDDPTDIRMLADRALAFLGPAGMAAAERGDPHAAISLLTRAADLAPPGRLRIELLITLVAALWTAGRSEVADPLDGEVTAWLAEHPDEGLDHRRWLLTGYYQGGSTGAIAQANAACAYYESVGDGMGMIDALEVALGNHAEHGQIAAATEILDQATALAIKIGRPDRAVLLTARAAALIPLGPAPVPESLAQVRQYLESAGSSPYARALLLMVLGQLEASLDVGDEWRRHFVAAKAIIDELGLQVPYGVIGYPSRLGDTELSAGEPARVVELLKESCATLDRLGKPDVLASMAPLTALVLLAAGRPDEVERYAVWGRDLAEPDDLDAHASWRMAISGLRLQQGRHDEAVTLARETVALLAGSEVAVAQARAQMSLANALRAAGDEPAALLAAEEARGLASRRQDRAALRKIDAFLKG